MDSALTRICLKVVERSVSNGMNDGFQGSNSGNVSVEQVEGRELETGQPEEDIIAAAEHPHQGEIGV